MGDQEPSQASLEEFVAELKLQDVEDHGELEQGEPAPELEATFQPKPDQEGAPQPARRRLHVRKPIQYDTDEDGFKIKRKLKDLTPELVTAVLFDRFHKRYFVESLIQKHGVTPRQLKRIYEFKEQYLSKFPILQPKDVSEEDLKQFWERLHA